MTILAKVLIEDLSKFISIFSTRGVEIRKKHGSRQSRVFTVRGDHTRVVVLFEWESKEAFEGFLYDPVVQETMKSAGVMTSPEFTFLEKVGEFPA